MLSQWWAERPDCCENVRELCRRLVNHFGGFPLCQCLLDVGMALTRSKCVAGGVPFRSLNVTVEDTMPPGRHIKNIQLLVDESDLSTRKLISSECAQAISFLQDFLWSENFETLGLGEAESADAHGCFSEVVMVLEDVKLVLDSAIGMEAGLQ